jgi:hypothetical protein
MPSFDSVKAFMQPSHAAPHAFREQKQQADGLFSDRLPAVFAGLSIHGPNHVRAAFS